MAVAFHFRTIRTGLKNMTDRVPQKRLKLAAMTRRTPLLPPL